MSKRPVVLSVGVASLACLMPVSVALAGQAAPDFYVVATLGRAKIMQTQFQIDNNTLIRTHASNPTGLRSSQTSKENAFKLQMGFAFSPNFAVEAGYVDLGNTSYTASYTANFSGGTAVPVGQNASAAVTMNAWQDVTSRRDLKISGLTLGGVFSRPITPKASVFGKLGVVLAEVRASDRSTGIGISYGFGPGANATESRLRPNYGVGVDYAFSKAVGLRAEAERFSKVGDAETTGSGDINLMSFGLVGRF